MALLYGRAGRLTAQTRRFPARADRESWNDGSRVPPHCNAKGEVVGGYTEPNVRREARAGRAAVGKAQGIRGHYFARVKAEH